MQPIRDGALRPLELVPLTQMEGERPSALIETFHSVLNRSLSSNTSRCRRVTHVAAKVFLSIACFVSTFSDLESARRNFDNVVLQNIFAYGDAIAWGGLSIYCVFELYHRFVERETFGTHQRMSRCAFIAQVSAVVGLGLISELPTAYTSYYYNSTTLFWCIYTPLILSFFGMESMNVLSTKILRSNSIFRKCCSDPASLRLIQAQTKFCRLIKYSNRALSNVHNVAFERKIIAWKASVEDKTILCRHVMLEVLKVGLGHVKEVIASTPRWMNRAKTATKVTSCFLPLGSPIVDGILIYKGFHLIFNQNWPIPVIILFAVGPGIYLQVKLTQKFWVSLLKSTVALRHFSCRNVSCNQVAVIAFKLSLIPILTVLGLATDTTVARDNVGFDNFRGSIIGISLIATMAILLISSMNSMINDGIAFYNKRKRSFAEIQYDNLLERVGLMEEYFKNLSIGDFNQAMSEMNFTEPYIKMLTEQDFQQMAFLEGAGNDIEALGEPRDELADTTAREEDEL